MLYLAITYVFEKFGGGLLFAYGPDCDEGWH